MNIPTLNEQISEYVQDLKEKMMGVGNNNKLNFYEWNEIRKWNVQFISFQHYHLFQVNYYISASYDIDLIPYKKTI